MRIFLIGYPGSGKSTVSRKLAAKLDYRNIDTDQYFEEKYKISINDFFDKYGEEEFRKREREVLEEVIKDDDIVVSTGGGMPCYIDNMEIINDSGISVYLKLHPKSLVGRIINSKTKRPLLKNLSEEETFEFVTKQLNEREKFYTQANYTIKGENLLISELVDLFFIDL